MKICSRLNGPLSVLSKLAQSPWTLMFNVQLYMGNKHVYSLEQSLLSLYSSFPPPVSVKFGCKKKP